MTSDQEIIKIIIPLLEMLLEDKKNIAGISKVLALRLPGLVEAEKAELEAGSILLETGAQTALNLINELKSCL